MAFKWPMSANLIKGKRGHFVAYGYVSVKTEITFNTITNGCKGQLGTTTCECEGATMGNVSKERDISSLPQQHQKHSDLGAEMFS